MNLIFLDDFEIRENLLPFTYTRPVADIRVGITTIREKWETYLNVKSSSFTEAYLSVKFPLRIEDDNILINGCVIPSTELINEIKTLKSGSTLTLKNRIIASRVKRDFFKSNSNIKKLEFDNITTCTSNPELICRTWDIFHKNALCIKSDFDALCSNRSSAKLSDSNQIIGDLSNLFVENGVKAEATIINVKDGPVYLGRNSEVMEGSVIRGPFSLGEGAVVKMGTKIYGATTVGPYAKVGGEINNSVIFGNSNKAHDGFLGNSVIGEWCNLGADTNTSNLKNNYSSVKVWNYASAGFADSGLMFCGLMMGDHSKCAINTMFNTGTVVGVNANIFGFGFPAKFIPSFSWDGASEQATFSFEQAIEVATRVMERRNQKLSEEDQKILQHIFKISKQFRYWEK